MSRTIGSYGPKTLEAIRKAGLRLIFEHGYEAMSLRQLAAEVGIQVGSLYNHISTKQELLFDLVQDHMNELLRQLDSKLEGKAEPRDKLRAFVTFHVTYHMTRKREVFIANSELRSLEPKNHETVVALRSAYEQRLADILNQGVASGVFEVVDVQVATFAILSLLTGLCNWYRPGGRLTKEAIIAAHEKLVLSGVAPRANTLQDTNTSQDAKISPDARTSHDNASQGPASSARGKRKTLRSVPAG